MAAFQKAGCGDLDDLLQCTCRVGRRSGHPRGTSGKMRQQWRELGEPTVILACPNCRKMFEEYLPELPVVFLEEVMEEWGMEKDAALEPDNAEKGEMEAGSTQQAQSYALFDPAPAAITRNCRRVYAIWRMRRDYVGKSAV